MAAGKSKTCPECGGRKAGRGFAHNAGCTKAARPTAYKTRGGRKGTRRRAGRRAGTMVVARGGSGLNLGQLKSWDVDQLMGLRDKIDGMVRGKAPELRRKIKQIKATLQSIRAR
jgi:hypothetical protein